MKAVRFQGVGRPPLVTDIAKPEPGPGQVVIKIGGAGACHSDLHILEHDMGLPDHPFTLGHENAGWVSELGAGVTGLKEGDAVGVYPCWGCGRCHACQQSAENYCENWATLGGDGGGVGHDGGMAEYMLVPVARLLVPLGDLDPRKVAPLSDAALTPYHAIKRVLPQLNADTNILLLGIGGLGHMALQLLRILTPARVIAGDVDPVKLEHAKALGADNVVNTRNADESAEEIMKITGPRGVGFVLDCVGIQPTYDLGAKVLRRNGAWSLVGLGGGQHVFTFGSTQYGVTLATPYGGTRIDMMEVVAMARNGRIHAETTEFALDDVEDVYAKLRTGQIQGRAVFTPELG